MPTFSFQSISIGIIEISNHFADVGTGIVSFISKGTQPYM